MRKNFNFAKRFITASALLAHSLSAFAESPEIVAVNWFDNLTYGGINTLFGIGVAAPVGILVNSVQGRFPSFRIDSTGQQIVITNASINPAFYYSTGLIHHHTDDHSTSADAHEAAHSKQSAIMGPLYLPMVGLTYAISGMDEGNMENWSEAWKDLGSTMVNRTPISYSLRLEDLNGGKSKIQRMGLSTAFRESHSRIDIDRPRYMGGRRMASTPKQWIAISNRYLPAGAVITTQREGVGCPSVAPISLEAGLFSRDFLAEWSVIDGVFTYLMDSKQDTGKVSIDLERGRIDSTFLRHEFGIGARYGRRDLAAVDLTFRAEGRLGGLWLLTPGAGGPKSPGLFASASVGGEARLHLLDYAQFFGNLKKEWGTGGYGKDSGVLGFETPIFVSHDDTTRGDQPAYLQGGAQYRVETETFSGPLSTPTESHVKVLMLTVGGSF